jgi:hypothetical protein
VSTKNRQQASSYKVKAEMGPVGSSLLANVRLRQGLWCSTNRRQASSSKGGQGLGFVGACLQAMSAYIEQVLHAKNRWQNRTALVQVGRGNPCHSSPVLAVIKGA